MTREKDDQRMRTHTRDEIARMQAAWPAHKWDRAYIAELGRGLLAAADTPDDITSAVTDAINTHDDKYPPSIAHMTQAVAKRRITRAQQSAAETRAKERNADARPRDDWHGWLAWAAHLAHRRDRGDAADIPPAVAPYFALVTDLGYRNQHGCGPWRDPMGRLHAADYEYDKALHATAVNGAEQIWRAGDRLPAPSPTFQMQEAA